MKTRATRQVFAQLFRVLPNFHWSTTCFHGVKFEICCWQLRFSFTVNAPNFVGWGWLLGRNNFILYKSFSGNSVPHTQPWKDLKFIRFRLQFTFCYDAHISVFVPAWCLHSTVKLIHNGYLLIRFSRIHLQWKETVWGHKVIMPSPERNHYNLANATEPCWKARKSVDGRLLRPRANVESKSNLIRRTYLFWSRRMNGTTFAATSVKFDSN